MPTVKPSQMRSSYNSGAGTAKALGLFASSVLLLIGCQTPSDSGPAREEAAKPRPGNSAAAERTSSPSTYTIDGETVHVNNRVCAFSGSPLALDNLEQFQSKVLYDGPLDKFRGKTLIFNQCCAMCIDKFPAKWAEERDAIMKAHHLL